MRIELNVTLACNKLCPNCNRLCHLYRDRKEHVTIHQVHKMIEQIRASGVPINRVKVAGGEPLLNPEFKEIYLALMAAIEEGLVDKVRIDSNGSIPYPRSLPTHPKILRGGSPEGRKIHLPVFVAPFDMELGMSTHCSVPKLCGFSLDHHGWLPCSAAIAIVRAFHLDDLYRYELPTKVWGVGELCHLCVFAMPRKWKNEHAKHLNEQYNLITPAWKFALNDSNGRTTADVY